MGWRKWAAISAVVVLAGCSGGAPETVERATFGTLPVMRWDTVRAPEQAARWTRATLAALDAHGQALSDLVPEDIEAWCPAYPDAPKSQRDAFWAGMLSSLAKHESTWNPQAVGGGGKWFGLVQIAPATARGYGCAATTGDALKDGSANLSCAIRIAAHTVPRDGVVAAGGRGFAADWGPFHSSAKREDIRTWVRSQPYCQK